MDEVPVHDAVTANPTPEQPKDPRNLTWVFGALAATTILAAGGYVFYTTSHQEDSSPTPIEETGNSVEETPLDPVGIRDDQIFLNGFASTGRTWPPDDADWSQELKDNPITKIREAYCHRIGYEYADFGGDCFVYQYFDAYKTYSNEEERFVVYYPTFWESDVEVHNYGFMPHPKVSLQRRGASCALSYGIIDENALRSSGVASTTKVDFGVRASGSVPDGELTKITMPFTRALTDEEEAAGYVNAKVVAVPHFPYPDSRYGFLVTSGEKQPLAEACVDEFNTILNSRAINYPVANLTGQSNGVLTIEDTTSWFESYADIPQQVTFLFKNTETKREAAIVPDAFKGLERISSPFLSGGKLYFMTSVVNAEIRSVDVMTGVHAKLPLAYDQGTPVHAFFVKGSDLYYLTGKFCNDYRAKCVDMHLHRYDLKTGATEMLASGLTSRDIAGFDAAGTKLILRYTDGDAGCAWGHYETFTLGTKTVTDLGSYSHCEGDPDDQLTALGNLAVGSDNFGHLIVKGGKIFAPKSNDAYPSGEYITVNLSEYPQE